METIWKFVIIGIFLCFSICIIYIGVWIDRLRVRIRELEPKDTKRKVLSDKTRDELFRLTLNFAKLLRNGNNDELFLREAMKEITDGFSNAIKELEEE